MASPRWRVRSGKKRPSDSDIRLEGAAKDAQKGGKTEVGRAPDHRGDRPRRGAAAGRRRRANRAARARPGPRRTRSTCPRPRRSSCPRPTSTWTSRPRRRRSAPSKPKPDDKKDETDSSSDFELTPVGEADPSPLELGSSEVEALPDGRQRRGEPGGELTGAGAAKSGINLQDPADSGISLEQGGSDEIEFELSLDAGATPKPGPVRSRKTRRASSS